MQTKTGWSDDGTNTGKYFEAGDVETLWVFYIDSSNVTVSVQVPDFVLVGAAYLSTAATSGVLALLMF